MLSLRRGGIMGIEEDKKNMLVFYEDIVEFIFEDK
jgi:hypothetical protein